MGGTWPRELLLLRHGKSSWDSGAPTDLERPLAKRGRRDAPRMGAWLREARLLPDLVLSSSAARARETAEAVLEAMGLDAGEVLELDERIYGAVTSELLHVLAERAPAEGRVMMVGHNPGFEQLVQLLASEPPAVPRNGKLLPTCAVARFGVGPAWEDLEPGGGTLLALARPKEL